MKKLDKNSHDIAKEAISSFEKQNGKGITYYEEIKFLKEKRTTRRWSISGYCSAPVLTHTGKQSFTFFGNSDFETISALDP